MFLVGETRAQRNEILRKKAPGKVSGDCRESSGNCQLLFSVIRSQIGHQPWEVWQPQQYRYPNRPGVGQAQIPGFYQQPACIWVCSESLFFPFQESLTGWGWMSLWGPADPSPFLSLHAKDRMGVTNMCSVYPQMRNEERKRSHSSKPRGQYHQLSFRTCLLIIQE